MQDNIQITSEPSNPLQADSGRATTRSKAANRESRADFLLDVAAEVFLEKGFEATSVGEIAQRAHASKDAFYSKFPSKNELFRAVIRRLMDRFASNVGAALATNQEPRKALLAFSGVILARMLSYEGVALQNIVFMESRRFPEVASIFFDLGPKPTWDALAEYFDAQVKTGTLRRMESRVAATHFMGLLTSEMMMLRSLGLLGHPTAEELSRRSQDAVDVFLRAYGA